MSLLPILSAGYRTIQLTQGYNTLVDMDDYNRFGSFSWYLFKGPRTFYARRNSKPDFSGRRYTIRLHIEITSPPPGLETHHKNHDGLDNRKENLEHRTPIGNRQDKLKQRNGVNSRFKGVCFIIPRQLWRARIAVNNQRIHIGYYEDEVEAARAYDAASRQFHGDMGSTNEKLFGKYWSTP